LPCKAGQGKIFCPDNIFLEILIKERFSIEYLSFISKIVKINIHKILS
jgi:hypothetical protein